MNRSHRSSAFTLVEILIVVVILGILASVVIPQFSSASQDAMKSTLRDQMKTINDMIEYYRVNNAGLLPTADPVEPFGASGGWGILVGQEYLKTEPVNMYAGGSTVADGGPTAQATAAAAAKGSATGWFFGDTGNRLDVYAAGYDEATDKLSNEP